MTNQNTLLAIVAAADAGTLTSTDITQLVAADVDTSAGPGVALAVDVLENALADRLSDEQLCSLLCTTRRADDRIAVSRNDAGNYVLDSDGTWCTFAQLLSVEGWYSGVDL